jgi:hypothetical protein
MDTNLEHPESHSPLQIKLYVLKFNTFNQILTNDHLQFVNLNNVLCYESVFYDDGFNARKVEVQETCSEPINAVRISDLFVQNIIVALTRSTGVHIV